MTAYLLLKIAGLLIAVLLLACAWIYLDARDAEANARQWRKCSREWECRANKATGFAQDAIATLAQVRNAIDERDAQIENQAFVIARQRADIECLEQRGRGADVQAVAATIRYGQAMRRGECGSGEG